MEYNFVKVGIKNIFQLSDEIVSQLNKQPILKIVGDNVKVVFEAPLQPNEVNILSTIISNHVADPDYYLKENIWRDRFPVAAKIIHIDIPNQRITVRKTISGVNFDRTCNITGAIRLLWQAGMVAVGDYVLVDMADGDPTKLIAIDKVYP